MEPDNDKSEGIHYSKAQKSDNKTGLDVITFQTLLQRW